MDPLHTNEDRTHTSADTPSDGTSLPSAGAAEAAAEPSASPDMAAVLQKLPLPRALRDWLVCVRKPALSMRYRVEKRHIPDLDTEPCAAEVDTAANHAAASKSTPKAVTPSPAATNGKGKNSDLMTLSGGFTIRYFDLAAGVFGLLLAGCLFKGCCWVKRRMK